MTQLVQGFDAGIDCRATSDHQHPDGLDVSVAGLGQPRRLTGQGSPSCSNRIDRIRLALAMPGLPIGTINLNHVDTGPSQIAGHTNPV